MYEKGTLELWARETLEVARHFKRNFTALYWEWITQVQRDIETSFSDTNTNFIFTTREQLQSYSMLKPSR